MFGLSSYVNVVECVCGPAVSQDMLEEVLGLVAPAPHGGAPAPPSSDVVMVSAENSGGPVTLQSLQVPDEVLQKHEGTLSTWLSSLQEHQSTFVRLINGAGTTAQVADLMKSSVVSNLGPDQRLLIFFDSKTCGEATAQAHVRLPGFNAERYKSLMQAVLTERKARRCGHIKSSKATGGPGGSRFQISDVSELIV